MKKQFFVCLLALAALTFGCQGSGGDVANGVSTSEEHRATASIDPKSGSQLTGSATFTNENGQVSLEIDLKNAPPGEHGVHIHEIGDCSAEDGTSAGGHWNPAGHDHGKWGEEPFHLGDIGNIMVGEDGTGSLKMSTDLWSIGTGQDNDVVGKAV
ncbi:MAG TPA: superoxide dismutase family protein, partial [Nitrospira sp.]|nr:superoxide dismutase family protein [Nitrospira sp.]